MKTMTRLEYLRRLKGWTQTELANKIPCSIHTICALERHKRHMSCFAIQTGLEKLLGESFEQLLQPQNKTDPSGSTTRPKKQKGG